LVESFTLGLLHLVQRDVHESLAEAHRKLRGRVPAAPRGRFLDYERMAITRALRETGWRPTAAARLLGLTKSTIYRRMKILGIPRFRGRGAVKPNGLKDEIQDPVLTRGAPVGLRAYERLALEHALEASGGHVVRASRLLGISKSAIYRRLRAHGMVARPPQSGTS